jgi:uncharacterized membrane protein
MTALRRKILAASLMLASSPLVLAQGTYTQIDDPEAVYNTVALGINTAGEIVGSYKDANGYSHGFLLSSGNYTAIDYPGGVETYLEGINDQGQIVGASTGSSIVGFVYDLQTMTFTTIADPAAQDTFPIAINNAGEIGGYITSGNKTLGFEKIGSKYKTVGVPGATYSPVWGITESGVLAGNYKRGGTMLNFSYSRGSYRKVSIPGAPNALVDGINPLGNALAGYYNPSPGFKAGFLYQNQTLTTLEFPGGSATLPAGINSSDVVVGEVDDQYGVHGFMWTPTPAKK